MAEERNGRLRDRFGAALLTRLDIATVVAISALTLSGLSFYRSYIYTKQQLDVTVTDVSVRSVTRSTRTWYGAWAYWL